ncbi:MAG: DJ-1/PfpI family protein [Clostridia bacterium]|nr:DJ-1/PfpI family protein [Clostridia bacterium]
MVYVFLADGFEETEAIAPIDILRRSKIKVTTVGIGSKTVTSSHGITVTADISENDAVFDDLDAVVLPGGMPGTLNLEGSATVQKFVDYATENDLYVCAICAAPSILGHKGILNGKKATCFPGFEKDLIGAAVTGLPAVCDGKVITGKGAGAAIEFGLLISEKLCGKDVSKRVRESMQCPQV